MFFLFAHCVSLLRYLFFSLLNFPLCFPFLIHSALVSLCLVVSLLIITMLILCFVAGVCGCWQFMAALFMCILLPAVVVIISLASFLFRGLFFIWKDEEFCSKKIKDLFIFIARKDCLQTKQSKQASAQNQKCFHCFLSQDQHT
jgi:hypothetical protein